MILMLLKKLIGVAIAIGIIYAGYHYLHNRGVPVPTPSANNSSGAVQGAQNAVQQSQDYQNQINQKASQYSQ